MPNPNIEKLVGFMNSMPYKLDQDHMSQAIEEVKRLQGMIDDPALAHVPRNTIESVIRILNGLAAGDHSINSRATQVESAFLAIKLTKALDEKEKT